MVTLKDFFSFQKNRFFWINLIAMIVVIIAVCWGTLYGLDIYTHHGESYVVPNVKNKSMLEAEKSLNAQQLKAIIVDSSYVKGMPAGMDSRGRFAGKGRTGCLSDRYNQRCSIGQTAGPDRQQFASPGCCQAEIHRLQTDRTGIHCW